MNRPMHWRRIDTQTHHLRRGDRLIAMVKKCATGWYWFGCGKNTQTKPAKSLDDAKRDAFSHAKTIQDAADHAEARSAR